LSSFINRSPYSIVAGKTGSLLAAGYCLGVVVEKEGNSVLIISLNSSSHYSRFQDVKSLAYWAFSNYEWPQ
jgi:D-alanyl-D-alanine carboxypeptidase